MANSRRDREIWNVAIIDDLGVCQAIGEGAQPASQNHSDARPQSSACQNIFGRSLRLSERRGIFPSGTPSGRRVGAHRYSLGLARARVLRDLIIAETFPQLRRT